MPGRQHKSLRLQARSAAAVKEELDGDDHPAITSAPNVVRSQCALKAEADDGESKPDISVERKLVNSQSRKFRRRCGSKYSFGSRYEYIMSITQRIKSSPADPVPGVGDRLFHNVYRCLIDAVVASQTEGTEEKTIEVDFNTDGSDSLEPLASREHYLEKILTLLLCMARMRVYNPPSDSEVVYYREIKKHIRCMIAFHEAKGNTKDIQCADSKDPASYHAMSLSQAISAVEELIELSGTLAETKTNIWDLNHKNGSAPDVGLHVRPNFRTIPEPNWSVEKVNAFCYNKLILVLHDLECSGLACLPPDGSEKKSLDELLDYVTSGSIHAGKVDKMDVSSDTCKPISITPRKRERETYEVMLFAAGVDKTHGLFHGRLFEYVQELRLSCLSFMLKLMDRMGSVVYPENLHRRFGKEATEIINQWTNKQKVNPERSPNYIEGIDRCIVLARYAAALIKGISSSVQDGFAYLTDMLRRKQHWYEFGPEALRVLSLLDCGAFRKAEDKMEIPLHAVSISDASKTKDDRVMTSLESDADNLKVLATTLHVLKDIGPLDAFVAPSPREAALLKQILEHVSLCIDGFLTTKAYLVERELTVVPASTLVAESPMHRINKNGIHRGFSLAYFIHGGKYLLESLSEDFERVQEDIDLMIPSMENLKVLGQKNLEA